MPLAAFLKVEKIPGESSHTGHDEWIEVIAYSHGLNQSITMSGSGTGALQAGAADHQMFSISKELDAASPKLAQHCASGEGVGLLTLELCRDIKEPTPYMIVEMEDAVVASYTPGGAQGMTTPTEEVSFAYEKITWTYVQTATATAAGGNIVGNFNRRTGVVDG